VFSGVVKLVHATLGSADQSMIRDPASKIRDFCVKDFSNSGAITYNLCLELAYFVLQPLQTSFDQHFP